MVRVFKIIPPSSLILACPERLAFSRASVCVSLRGSAFDQIEVGPLFC